MFELQDIRRLGYIHAQLQTASQLMGNLEGCKTNTQERKYRIEARKYMNKSRRKIREHKKFLQRKYKKDKELTIEEKYLLS